MVNQIDESINLGRVELSPSLVSSPEEIEQLATELADEYTNYLFIDTSVQRRRVEESQEECLAHLEEVCSILDGYRQKSDINIELIKTLKKKSDSLQKLYHQIDAISQYTLNTNKLLDELDAIMKELESTKPSGNRIKQIIDLIPQFSISGLSGLNPFGSVVEETSSNDQTVTNESQLAMAPVKEILAQVTGIVSALIDASQTLNKALFGDTKILEDSSPVDTDNAVEHVDGSWQELL